MTALNEQLPEKVVTAFKNILSDEARTHITDNEFHELAQIVHEALSRELSEAAEMVDDVVKRLRSMTDRRDLDL